MKISAIFMCPPLKDYPEAPKDQSASELFDCPKCNEKMWLSYKKKNAILLSNFLNRNIILACYACITEMVKNDPSWILDAKSVKL